jgi:hypothetical protein
MQVYIGRIPDVVFPILIAVAAATAFWRGGRDGAVVSISLIVQEAVVLGIEGPTPPWLAFSVDLATLAICLALVLTGRNHWTIVAAASQLLTIATYGLNRIVELTPWSYYSAQRAWTLLLIASLLVGSLLSKPRPRGSPSGRR